MLAACVSFCGQVLSDTFGTVCRKQHAQPFTYVRDQPAGM